MKAVYQRVRSASVTVEGETIASIGPGVLLLVGVTTEDTPEEAALLARKAAQLRVFDRDGKFGLSVLDVGGAVLAVRPEDIALRSASGAGMARIESVMPLGHYTQIILVRADGARLKVFIPKEQALGYIPGQTADYSFTRFKQFGAAQASA